MTNLNIHGPVRGSASGRPIMLLLDLLGRRMTLRILWELSRAEGPMTFRNLEVAAETNPALLNTRLKELRAAGLVVHGEGGYTLSSDAQVLLSIFHPLNDWSKEWSERLDWNERQRARVRKLQHEKRSTA